MALELFHNPLSTCSQKVRLALAEKCVPWESRPIDLMAGEQTSPEYLAVNPRGVVPTLVHDGTAIFESSIINEYVDEAFEGPSLTPDDPQGRASMRVWIRRIDDEVHPAMGALTLSTVIRRVQLTRPREEVLGSIERVPEPAQRSARVSIYERGVEAPEVAAALSRFTSFLRDMNTALTGDAWPAAPQSSLADFAAVPYVLRAGQMGLLEALDLGSGSPITEWIESIQTLPAYETAVARFVPADVTPLVSEAAKPLLGRLHLTA